jgi:hypothetical protein
VTEQSKPPPEAPLFEILEAVEYAARHDNTVVLIQDGQVRITRPADRN